MSRLKWNGPAVAAQVRKAQLAAIDETTGACATSAASRRSGRAARITAEPAQARGAGAVGRWGMFPEPRGEWFPELFVEAGNQYRAGDHAKRRAADEEYPQLAGRIRRRVR